MAYLTNQVIGVLIFVVLIILSIIGLRSRTVIIHEITRHSCTGDTCPLSLDLTVYNPLRMISTASRGFYAYIVMQFLRDDGSAVQFFRGFIPSLSNTWRVMDFIPSVRLFNMIISGDGIHVTDILIPYPSSLEVAGSPVMPFDMRTGEPTGVVNFISIRRALASELGDKLVQSMSLAEIIRRVAVSIAFYNGAGITKYSTTLSKLLAQVGVQVDGEVRIVEGSINANLRRRAPCLFLFGYRSCLGKTLRTTWGWAVITEALMGLVYAFTSVSLPLIAVLLIYVVIALALPARLT